MQGYYYSNSRVTGRKTRKTTKTTKTNSKVFILIDEEDSYEKQVDKISVNRCNCIEWMRK